MSGSHSDAWSVGLVVIGRNEGVHLNRTLRAAVEAAAQSPVPTRVLYVDGSSSDDSLRIAAGFPGVEILEASPGRTYAAALRNLGWRAVSTTHVQFVDGDVEIDPQWIGRGLLEFDRAQVAAVVGTLSERALRASLGNWGFGLEWGAPHGDLDVVGGCGLWSRSVLEQLGGFAENLPVGEDPDLALRARRLGFRLRGVPVPMGQHDLGIRGWGPYWNRAVRVGQSRALIVARHGDRRGRRRQFRDRCWVLSILLGVMLAAIDPRWAWGLLALGGLWALREICAGRREALPWTDAFVRTLHRGLIKVPVVLGSLRTGSLPRALRVELVGVLAPELPSVSATFVHRELLALQGQGLSVVPYSLRRVDRGTPGLSADALGVANATSVVYSRWWGVRSLVAFATGPGTAVRVLSLCLRDVWASGLSRWGQRCRVLAQGWAAIGMASDLQRRGIQHLHIHFIHAPATVGMYAAAGARIPFSVTAHAHDLFVAGTLVAQKVERSAWVIAVSEEGRWHLKGIARDPTKIRLLHCGVDTRRWKPVRQGTPSGSPRVVAVARLVRKKGIDLLIHALLYLQDAEWDLQVDLVGDGPERAELEKLAARLGLTSKVRFYGAADESVIRRLLGGASLFVLPCRVLEDGDRDGIPVALMEAMAMAVPVVTTSVGGISELVRDGDTGFLVPQDDPLRLASVLRTILNRGQPMSSVLAARGRRHVMQDFDLHENARRLTEWIRGEWVAPSQPGDPSEARDFPVREPVGQVGGRFL